MTNTNTAKYESKLVDLYDEMETEGVLEDRREYDVDDLRKMYDLTEQEGKDLYYLIQNPFKPDDEKWIGQKLDPTKFYELVVDSIDEGLSAWDEHDRITIQRFLDDIVLGYKHA